jgi:hypothetical protein
MSQTAAHLVDHVMRNVLARQWVTSRLIALLLARSRSWLLQCCGDTGCTHASSAGPSWAVADEAHCGAVTLIQRLGQRPTRRPDKTSDP